MKTLMHRQMLNDASIRPQMTNGLKPALGGMQVSSKHNAIYGVSDAADAILRCAPNGSTLTMYSRSTDEMQLQGEESKRVPLRSGPERQ